MAQIRVLAWNIEVYGPNKFANVPNHNRIVWFIARAAAQQNANVVVLMELMNSVAYPICWALASELTVITNNQWGFVNIPARPLGDREQYGILWQEHGAPFTITYDGGDQPNHALSTVDFPNNFSVQNGRRAALATFRTNDTGVNFTVAVYHAPPNGFAAVGLECLAKTPGLYSVNNAGAVQNVPARVLAGDYNLDVNVYLDYQWLTDHVPVAPPPAAAGQGAGSAPITTALSHYHTVQDVVNTWGGNVLNWSGNPLAYRDLQLDNIFWASPNAAPAPGGGVIDVVQDVMNPNSHLRNIAQRFNLFDHATMQPAFPRARSIPLPLEVNLSHAQCAYLLFRAGISDHLPVFNSVTI